MRLTGFHALDSRSPHGERGLKYSACRYYGHGQQSLSSWRAWIEIVRTLFLVIKSLSRSPHGERGLKYTQRKATTRTPCRSPHGERGLKSHAGRRPAQRRRRSPHGERGLKSVSASFRPPRGCCFPCLCPVFPAHAGFHMCGTASNGKPGFLSARGDFNGNTSRNCDWVFRMGSLLKAM